MDQQDRYLRQQAASDAQTANLRQAEAQRSANTYPSMAARVLATQETNQAAAQQQEQDRARRYHASQQQAQGSHPNGSYGTGDSPAEGRLLAALAIAFFASPIVFMGWHSFPNIPELLKSAKSILVPGCKPGPGHSCQPPDSWSEPDPSHAEIDRRAVARSAALLVREFGHSGEPNDGNLVNQTVKSVIDELSRYASPKDRPMLERRLERPISRYIALVEQNQGAFASGNPPANILDKAVGNARRVVADLSSMGLPTEAFGGRPQQHTTPDGDRP